MFWVNCDAVPDSEQGRVAVLHGRCTKGQSRGRHLELLTMTCPSLQTGAQCRV